MGFKRTYLKKDDSPYFIAEIGINHNGDINLCKNLKYNDFRFEVEMLMAYQIRNLRIYEQDIKSIYFRGTKSTLSIADVLRLIQILFFFKIEIK